MSVYIPITPFPNLLITCMLNEQLLTPDEADLVLRVLQQTDKPLNLSIIKKALPQFKRKREKQLRDQLQAFIKKGDIHVHRGHPTVYWLPELEVRAGERIIKEIENSPLPLKKLEKKYKSILIGWPKIRRNKLLERLIKDGRIYKIPDPKGTSFLLSTLPAQPNDYLQKPILELADKFRKIAIKLERSGITTEQFFAAASTLWQQTLTAMRPSAKNSEQLILDGMTQLDHAATTGALVSLTELRQVLATQISEKPTFDRAVLKLAKEGRVVLHRHVFPNNLNSEERESLVNDEHGNFFVGVAFKV